VKFAGGKRNDRSCLYRCIQLQRKLYESVYNYLAVHHVISLTSLTLYLLNGCFSVKCLLPDQAISAAKFLKLDLFFAMLLIIGFAFHFCRVPILVYKHNWFGLQAELDQMRVFYPKEHDRIMKSRFGRAGHLKMNRRGLNKGEYKISILEEFEKKCDAKEDRFNELQRSLGHQYCYGLEPSAVGYRRCIMHLVLE